VSTVLAYVLVLALDAGALVDAGLAWLSPEDLEVVDNLELLQNLDNASDLELLQELSIER